ncbi:MAG: hypothetical protein FD174_4109 [Geobacteraceae bacterium]|nr:MAG: hypothetical protein FD174_4109 [Geobacteraceae bacterium]
MTRFISCTLFCALLLLWGTAGMCTTFDERLWEKYAEIESSSSRGKGSLAGLYLEPHQLGEVTAKIPFADLRVVSDRKEEVPWQIVSRRPEKRQEEIPHQMQNLSHTENGETWLEMLVDKQEARANAVEIITPNTDFSRQVQVLGSSDGKTWNTLRKDGVIFDITRGEKLRHTRITFPQASFSYLALKIANGGAQPLSISDVKVLQESDSEEQTYTIHGTTVKPELNASRQESSIIVHMNTVFPLDRLIIATAERNFQRSVEVQIKRGTGDWEHWAQGTIFSFDTPAMHESQLAIDMPEVATKEFRLVFKNLDSPPLSVTSLNGEGYRRLLVFKQQSDHHLYLFWGNPLAQQPQYDLAGIVSKQKLDALPIAHLGQARPNTKFAGNNARLPFTERYKYLLYIVVTLGIAGLVFLQYRVFRRVEQ